MSSLIADQRAAQPAAASYDLPAYAGMLAAYQRAHAGELQTMLADLPLGPGDQVLDMACGSGTYSCWLAELVGPQGLVVGVDIDPAFLEAARHTAAAWGMAERVLFRRGDIAALPVEDGCFDLAWCAQSMYTLPDPLAALRELRRVVRPGGTVAVFENDSLHQVILPWPAELELALRQAQLRSFVERSPGPDRFYIARNFCPLFRAAGFTRCQVAAYTSVRQAPLAPNERIFLEGYLQELRDRAWEFLAPVMREQFAALSEPGSRSGLLDDPDLCVTYIDLLARGVK